MRVAALLVVGQHDVRPLLADQPDERLDRLVEWPHREAAGVERRRLATLRRLGQPRVDEAEVDLADPRTLIARTSSRRANAREVGDDLWAVHRGVEDVAELTAGAGDDEHVDAFAGRSAPSSPRPCSTRRRGARARPSAAALGRPWRPFCQAILDAPSHEIAGPRSTACAPRTWRRSSRSDRGRAARGACRARRAARRRQPPTSRRASWRRSAPAVTSSCKVTLEVEKPPRPRAICEVTAFTEVRLPSSVGSPTCVFGPPRGRPARHA